MPKPKNHTLINQISSKSHKILIPNTLSLARSLTSSSRSVLCITHSLSSSSSKQTSQPEIQIRRILPSILLTLIITLLLPSFTLIAKQLSVLLLLPTEPDTPSSIHSSMAAMGSTMGLNLILLVAMVAANILSLYHLTSTLQSKPITTTASDHQPVPEHLVRQLQTIRATINHLTRLQNQPTSKPTTTTTAAAAPQDLLLYSHLAPIASSCHEYPELLHQYMTYTPFTLCPPDNTPSLAESLILRGCHPLPRRRCFSRTPPNPTSSSSLPSNPFPQSPLPDTNVIWPPSSPCKSFKCLNPKLGFSIPTESTRFLSYKSELDLPIPQLLSVSNSSRSPIRIGLDIGGGTGTFAARMKLDHNITILTTTMDLGYPYSEAAALRGVIPIHAPLQQRLPVFDGVLDLVRCGHAVNRWIPSVMMEFMFYDLDRVLRGGGYLWLDHFFCKRVDLEKVYKPMVGNLGYKIVKWATGDKQDSKNGEVYVTALLQKPKLR